MNNYSINIRIKCRTPDSDLSLERGGRDRFWPKLTDFSAIRENRQNLSKMTDFSRFVTENRFFQDFGPKSVIFDRFWQQNLSFQNLSNLTDFELRICQIWQIADFFRIFGQNLSFLTDFDSKICHFEICQIWQILNSKSVKFDRKQIFLGFWTKICHFWQILAIDRCNDDFWKNLSHSPHCNPNFQ